MNAGTIVDVEPNPEQSEPEIDEGTTPDNSSGGRSPGNDDVPY